jgi:hypothetical protein
MYIQGSATSSDINPFDPQQSSSPKLSAVFCFTALKTHIGHTHVCLMFVLLIRTTATGIVLRDHQIGLALVISRIEVINTAISGVVRWP